MKRVFEKINFALLVILVAFVGFNIYLNLSGYANQKVVIDQLKKDFLYDIPNQEKLREGQLKGLVSNLGDPYASYISKDETEEFDDSLNQRYEGIGVSFNFKDTNKIIVSKVFESSPAFDAGVKKDDVLTKINETGIENKSQDEIINSIRGEIDTSINLTFERIVNGVVEEKNFDIKRGRVEVDLVEIRTEENLIIATIRSFGDNIASEFNNEIRQYLNQEYDTIVINVLDNPGGRLEEATKILSNFAQNDEVILKEKTKDKTIDFKATDRVVDLRNYNAIVLINENSASASEILAASLKEIKPDTLVYGRQSFGKGVVQKVATLPNGALLKYTIAEWLTPGGESIDKIGVKVDKEFPNVTENLERVIIDDILNLQ